ncbi:MAG: aminopeptidase [Chitinivibrionales bacterium]
MEKDFFQAYASVALEVGVNLYPGQCLNIRTGVQTYDFALELARQAYKKGAKFVDIDVRSAYLTKARVEAGNENDLSFMPHYLVSRSYEQLANDWAFISIDNTEETDVCSSVDPRLLGTVTRTSRKALKRSMEGFLRHEHTWCIVAAPGAHWAAKVLNSAPDEKSTKRLIQKLIPILRLDEANPVRAWKQHGRTLIERCNKLNKLRLDRLHFIDEGTDLHIGLNRSGAWIGGPGKTPDGRFFFPNLPTEEVFTTPDFHRAEGRVRVTRPVKIMDTIVDGVWFEFRGGKLVAFGAQQGREMLEKMLTMDEGASNIGEVALVGIDSPVYQSGLLFNSILYDENASSHIALGNGFPTCVSRKGTLQTDEEKKRAGCNVSLVHTDFMIGTAEMKIDGYSRSGRKIPIMREGRILF